MTALIHYHYSRILYNLNLLLTQSNFHFPSGRFLYNFILDNSSFFLYTGIKSIVTKSTYPLVVISVYSSPNSMVDYNGCMRRDTVSNFSKKVVELGEGMKENYVTFKNLYVNLR